MDKLRLNDISYISCIFLDEMGLAELSKSDPLKVLHRELETPARFFGVSN